MTDERLHNEILEALDPVLKDGTHIVPIDMKSSDLSKPITTLKRSTHATRTDEYPEKKTRSEGPVNGEEANIPDRQTPCLPNDSEYKERAPDQGADSDRARSTVQASGSCEETIVIVSESQSGGKRDSSINKVSNLGQIIDKDITEDTMKDKKPSKAEVVPVKSRSGDRRKKSRTGAFSKPAARSKENKAATAAMADKKLIQSENRRVTRSMTKKAEKAAEMTDNKDTESNAPKRTPAARVTRSRSKPAAKKTK